MTEPDEGAGLEQAVAPFRRRLKGAIRRAFGRLARRGVVFFGGWVRRNGRDGPTVQNAA